MLAAQTLKFLGGLKKNNNKEWFEAHRLQYEAAKTDFSNFIQLVIDAFQKIDPSIAGLTSKDCMFRINRDVRFSKDKSPYKTNFGAIIKPGGRKSVYAGYYFHCAPGNSFMGGGLWLPAAAELKKVRQEIDYNWNEFNKIIKEKNFRKIYSDIFENEEIKLSSVPKGYAKDHPAIDYLKLKCFIAEATLKDDELTKSSLHKKTISGYEALMPLIHFINKALE
ncbi:MAG: DUF2461 domain-containing protein [Flavisolibacter sp.]